MGLQTDDARQEELIRSLQDDANFLQTSLEDLKTIIQDKLNPPQPRSSDRSTIVDDRGSKLVYLVCDQRDVAAIEPIYNHLFEAGLEVMLPQFEGDEADVRQEHQANLCNCDAVMIYYGEANESWFRAKLRDLQKVVGYGRTKPMLAKALYVAGPQTPQKQMLRTHEALMIKNFEAFSLEALAPFMTLIV